VFINNLERTFVVMNVMRNYKHIIYGIQYTIKRIHTFTLIKLLALWCCCVAASGAFAQNTLLVKGRLIDALTRESVPFANMSIEGTTAGALADVNGYFKLRVAPGKIVKINSVGYKIYRYTVPATAPDSLLIELTANTVLSEVTIKPKKYRNKNNPAVDFIEQVVKNRKANRIEAFDAFQEEQYEKILMGITDISDKMKSRRIFRSLKVVTDNTDTTLLEGSGITPVYLQETVQDFYSKDNPKRQKIWIKGQQKIKFPLMDSDGLDRYLRYMYEEANIYDNYVVLLTDHFLSPIADNAPLFYRYYLADTMETSGSKVVHVQFFPRNKTDMLLQGDLYVALDSTYPVTHIRYTVNPNINLNWVDKLEMDQSFLKTSNGKWVLHEETYMLDFGVFKKGMGVFAKRYVSHQNPTVGGALSDTVFRQMHELRTMLPKADVQDTAFWGQSRHVELSRTEANTYKAMDSLKNTLWFRRVSKAVFTIAAGHYSPTPGLEIGRINTFFSFNPVEGYRARFGGRTNPDFSKRINLEGFVAYGFTDQRWKYGIGANITLTKDRAYNRFPYNMLRINYQEDLITPGVVVSGAFTTSNLGSSVVRGENNRFFFQKKFVLQYEREFFNNFSYIIGFEHRNLAALGSLTYTPAEGGSDINEVITAKPYIQLRYAPGEEYFQSNNGGRQRIRFNSIAMLRYSRGIKGVLNSNFNFDEVTVSYYKYSRLPPIGYNYLYMEAGGIFGKVPYSLLTVHTANQTFANRFLAYNLMNFMEFVSDRYVAVNMEHSFYGFFTNKIPLLRHLKLREYVTCKVLYGQVSAQNQPRANSGLFEFPKYADGTPLTYTLEEKPYMEIGVGVGNIFKIIRLDFIRRMTYLDHPGIARFGVRIGGRLEF
jgi:Family of unknown function (DUF5686)/CarboxypepD_reg-like domain